MNTEHVDDIERFAKFTAELQKTINRMVEFHGEDANKGCVYEQGIIAACKCIQKVINKHVE